MPTVKKTTKAAPAESVPAPASTAKTTTVVAEAAPVKTKTRVKTTTTGKKKAPAAVETSISIEEQTKAFLESGGAIEHINSGVSGQQSVAGPRHITISNKPRTE